MVDKFYINVETNFNRKRSSIGTSFPKTAVEILSILDMPCGDFSWMQDLIKKNNSINYTSLEVFRTNL